MRRAAIGGLVGLVLLALAEALCAAFPAPTMVRVPEGKDGADTLMNGSPWLLWELVPGEHRERGGHVTIDRQAMRDIERGPKQRPRAMAVGDSSVYGFGNDDEDVFTSVLESRIDADFINAAVPGYSSFQALNLLRGRALAMEPDLLLVATLWSDNNFDSFSDRDLLASYAGWEAGAVRKIRSALASSALFTRLDWELRVEPAGARAKTVGWQVGGDDARSGNRRVSLSDYASNLDSFCKLMEERAGGVVYVLLANREDIAPVSHDPAWTPYRTAMRQAAERCGAPLVDVPAAFVASGQSADGLFLDLMHPTRAGHRVLAEAVEATLIRAGWPASPLRARLTRKALSPMDDRFEGHGTVREAAGSRGTGVDIELRWTSPSPGALVVALRDGAPGASTIALGSVTVREAGRARVQVPSLPAEVIVGVTLDRAGDGPSQGDPHVDLPTQAVPAQGPLVIDLDRWPPR